MDERSSVEGGAENLADELPLKLYAGDAFGVALAATAVGGEEEVTGALGSAAEKDDAIGEKLGDVGLLGGGGV